MFPWDYFLRVTSNRSLYILGAGASYPEIVVSNNLPNEIRKMVWRIGIFEASIQPTSPLKSAILDPNSAIQQQNCFIGQQERDAFTSPDLLEVLLPQILTRKEPIFPAQYRVFNLFHPSVIFNFNNDNLADRVDSKHEVLNPHKKIDPAIAYSPYMQEAIDWLNTTIIPQTSRLPETLYT